ncbi:glycoside hydrolase family 97 protein [Flavobacterium sp. ZS1P14]|uniref:glycoside hydrolase family 97 protein n=1 Tax=Flavobacterium sp. ZS1P14 TaxID=3401729 RepID=UPI003AAE7E4C
MKKKNVNRMKNLESFIQSKLALSIFILFSGISMQAQNAITGTAQKQKNYLLTSPDNKLSVNIKTGLNLSWSVAHDGQAVVAPSVAKIALNTGEVLGKSVEVISAKEVTINETFSTVAYKKDKVQNWCKQLTLKCKGGYGIVFRAYNHGVAYRFFITGRKDNLIIQSEQAEFNFDKDYTAFISHISGLRGGEKYSTGFEEFYTETPLSKFNKDTLGTLPMMVKLNNNKKVVVLEADVQDYPGMFIQYNKNAEYGIKATFAPYPTEEKLGGLNNWNDMVIKRGDYIAKVKGTRSFPWRIVAVSEKDKDLLNNDIVQCLSEPNKISNTSWIKPGKVAWDYWNDWNISHVDFKAGVNTQTYKHYIDFAAANHLEYVILDEGWSDIWDMNKVKPNVDLKELIAYGKQKNVDLILWCIKYALSLDPEGFCAKYSAMGIKGFKIDFLDRNDQKMTSFCYEIASVAAKHHLLIDFHGVFPPQGLQRTWPNAINFEGVRGLENMKGSNDDRALEYDLSIPYLRMMAGPMDYTPGAMRNATRGKAQINYSSPMSMGTRCHQMAMYVLYEAPLQMLSDSPTAYMKEQECTDFIAGVPTVFNETVALDGQFGEYAIIARKKDNVWYVGGMTNWNDKDVTVDFSFLGAGNYTAEIFKDGINAGKDATDYKKEIITVDKTQKINLHLASGGGFAIRLNVIK